MTKLEELKQAKEMYFKYIEAEKAVLTGQEYRLGTRQLRRVDLSEIRKGREYWEDEVNRLEGRPKNRVYQVIPRNT